MSVDEKVYKKVFVEKILEFLNVCNNIMLIGDKNLSQQYFGVTI